MDALHQLLESAGAPTEATVNLDIAHDYTSDAVIKFMSAIFELDNNAHVKNFIAEGPAGWPNITVQFSAYHKAKEFLKKHYDVTEKDFTRGDADIYFVKHKS